MRNGVKVDSGVPLQVIYIYVYIYTYTSINISIHMCALLHSSADAQVDAQVLAKTIILLRTPRSHSQGFVSSRGSSQHRTKSMLNPKRALKMCRQVRRFLGCPLSARVPLPRILLEELLRKSDLLGVS